MDKLLYLVHRIPYPANKGDKIRSFNFLKVLAEKYRIHLGCFIDDPEDLQYVQALQAWCAETCCIELKPTRRKLLSLQGLVTGEALSLPYYRHASMQAWVDRTVREQGIQRMLAFSSPMALYVEQYAAAHRVADFVDVDSDKWRQYAEKKSWPLSWVYRRESRKLLAFERRIAGRFSATSLVSAQEAELLKTLAPEAAARITHVNNGVDTGFFDPALSFASPFPAGQRTIVFTGAMDYWANADAVQWFATQVLPLVRLHAADARFYIVGSKPGPAVQALADADPAVTVTGRVEEIRAYLAHADVVVAPLRIARGIQNKVLEAMAMARPIVATAMAMEGIAAGTGLPIAVADDPQAFAAQVVDSLQHPRTAAANRDFVLAEFAWSQSGQALHDLLEAAP